MLRYALIPAGLALAFAGAALIAVRSPIPSPSPAGWARIESEVTPFAGSHIYSGIETSPSSTQSSAGADAYLCQKYQNSEFAWKDRLASQRRGMALCDYVIGGLNPGFKEALIVAGKEADARGIKWEITSGFRDDYRQSIATGLKARTGYSMHGGSRVTGGYGDGRAVDVLGPPDLFAFIDNVGKTLGLIRPHKSFDPVHVQFARQHVAPIQRASNRVRRSVVAHADPFRKGKRARRHMRQA